MATPLQVEQYREQGYFIVDDAVAPDMLAALEAGARRAVEKVRSGAVVATAERISTGGPGVEPRNILGLIAPEFGEPIFAEYLMSEPVETYVRALVGSPLRLGWAGLIVLHGPTEYDTGWHRDFGQEERDGSREVELEILGRYRKNLVKWHLALVEDACLWLVPGSQRRYRTEQEREVLINNRKGDVPNAQQIALQKGQTIFWNGNTIHRGLLSAGATERLTLMGALAKHEEDQREALDERFRWQLADNVRAGLPARMQELLRPLASGAGCLTPMRY